MCNKRYLLTIGDKIDRQNRSNIIRFSNTGDRWKSVQTITNINNAYNSSISLISEFGIRFKTHEIKIPRFEESNEIYNLIVKSFGLDHQIDIINDSDSTESEKRYFISCRCEENIILRSKNIFRIEPSIGMLREIRMLHLSDNKIKSLPKEMGELKNLERLDISNNRLLLLPNSIGKLRNLYYLNVAQNSLTNLPFTVTGLRELKCLDIRHNKLTHLPETLLAFKYLSELYFSHNKITKIPYGFLNLQNLKSREFNRQINNVYDEKSFVNVSKKITSLEERCLRKIVDETLDIPKKLPNYLKDKLRTAKECYYCGNSYFDYSSEVLSTKTLENNEKHVFSENLCTDHYYDEKSRSTCLFSGRENEHHNKLIKSGYPRISAIFSAYSYNEDTVAEMIKHTKNKKRKNIWFDAFTKEFSETHDKFYTLASGLEEVEIEDVKDNTLWGFSKYLIAYLGGRILF